MTLFITGDNFQRGLTAKDANRLLKVAKETDAGAGNLTSKQLKRAWENGHILVRNDYPLQYRLYAYSTVGIGPATYRYNTTGAPLRGTQDLNVWSAQKLNIKKHWFRHGVIQQSAAYGEIVPCAVSGVTFAIARTPILDTSANSYLGTKVAFDSADYLAEVSSPTEWGPWSRRGMGFASDSETFVGQAEMLVSTRFADPAKSRILIRLNRHNIVWKAQITNRISTKNFDGYISSYGTPYGDLKIYDPMSLMPGTDLIPNGAMSATVGIEITQGQESPTSDNTNLPDITGYIVCLQRSVALEGVTMETPPI